MRRTPVRHHLLAATLLCIALAPSRAAAQEAERQGGRFGVSLFGGIGNAGGSDSGSATMGLSGLSLRFGSAMTDRFHLLGEFTLGVMPGGRVAGLGDVTAFHAALDFAGEGYIGPRFFLRGGVGAGWASANAGNTWYLPLPGPRFSGAVGYALWRRGTRQFSLALETSYTMLFRASSAFDRLITVALHVGFDWY